MTGNDVEYTYGTSGNETGRPVRIVDGSGMYECTYDKLGNVTDETRTIALPQHSEVYQFRMLYQYDSWGRMLTMTYPDGEEITYTYQWGGDLYAMDGIKNGDARTYIKRTLYNNYGQKSYVEYGNTTRAYYTYDALHRLVNLRSRDYSGALMQDIDYTFDNASNVTKIANNAGVVNTLGGAYENTYKYDVLHRLEESYGGGAIGNYNTYITYSPSGRLIGKTRENNSVTLSTSVEMAYGYCDDYQPHAVKRMFDYKNGMLYDMRWDKAGNLGQVSMAKPGEMFEAGRFLFWTEDSRLVGVVDDNFYSYYAYGHDGERALKLAGKNSQMDVNAGTYTCQALLDDATLYPSPHLVASRKGYTKHYFAGAERICARIGDGGLDRFGTFQCTDTALSNRAMRLFKDCNSAMLSRQLQTNDGPSVEAVCGKTPIELQEKVKDVPVHVDATVSVDLYDLRKAMSNYAGHLQPYGEETFYYHGDHLGSASWITDKNGIPVQHLQYLPFGEPYVSQHAAGGYEERFTFTGKERDEETGYGYFGARYMDHELMTMWLSVDPMADKYPNISPYAYCIWNPIVLIDPDGNEGIVVSGGEYDGDRYKYNFIEPTITKLKALKAAAGNEPITWVVMTAGYSESDMASFQKIARDLGVGFQAISSADEFTNYLNAKSIGSAELSEARRNDPITSICVFGHGYAGSAEFAHNQPGQGRFSWGTDNVKQLDAGAFKNATVDFYTCNSATDPEKGKSLGYVFSQQTGAVVTGYRGKSTYAKMNVGEGIGAKWDRLWEGFNPNGSVRLPQAGEGAIRIKFLPPVMNGNQ